MPIANSKIAQTATTGAVAPAASIQPVGHQLECGICFDATKDCALSSLHDDDLIDKQQEQ